MTKKLPPAKDWQARDVEDWNVTTFHAYMSDKHRELFGCEYVPFRGWQAEKGMMGRLIGTRGRPGTHDKAIIKRFIDEGFKSYKPTAQYPGTSFGFLYSYRRNILQRLEAEQAAKEKWDERGKQAGMSTDDYDKLSEWL